MIMRYGFLSLMFFLSQFSISQSDSVSNFILPVMKISKIEMSKPVTYLFENEKNLFTVEREILKADTTWYKFETNIKDVLSVSIKSGNHLWGGAGIGAAVGLIAGYTIGGRLLSGDNPNLPSAISYGLIGALSMGLIFGVIGHNSPSYDVYEFKNENLSAKRDDILKILRMRGKQNK